MIIEIILVSFAYSDMALSLPFYFLETLLLLAILVFLFIKYMGRNYSYWNKKGIRYLDPIPIFGNFLPVFTLQKHLGVWLADVYKSTKAPYVGVYVLDRPFLVVRSRDLIKQILIKDFQNFPDR